MPDRRSPFRSSLVIEPLWWRFVLAVLALLVYAGAFAPLYRGGGVGVSALSIFPVVIIGWLFGAWGGLIAGGLSVPLNAGLLSWVGEPGWEVVIGQGGVEGSALVVVVGCVIGLLRDVGVRLDRYLTDWRQAERALRDSEDRYRILFERARDPIYVSRPGGPIVDANEAFVRMFGYSKASLLDLDVVKLYEDPTDRDRFAQQIQRDGFVKDFPVRLVTRDGEVRECLLTATARFDDGRALEYQGTIHDVSESGSLQQLAELRTRELQEALGELEAFAYSVSHDLRTHLVTMGGFASMLWSEHRDQLDDDGREYLGRIVEAGRRMDDFVRDLLGLSQVSRAPLRPTAVELRTVVDDALQTLAPLIEARGADVAVEGELGAAHGDRMVIARAVENLLSNAVKFVDSERAPRVRVRATRVGAELRLEVEDNGIGLAGEELRRAFRPFERLHPARFEGTGIGLAIVERAAHRLGGSVDVTSVPGEGSTFRLTLPAPREPVP